MAVLFGWTYFFGPSPAEQEKQQQSAETSAPAPSASPAEQAVTAPAPPPTAASQESNPDRTITIRSHLYEAKIDAKGAVATSWIILKDKNPYGEREVYGDGSTKSERKPVQLISERAREARNLPFAIVSGDAAVDSVANGVTYRVSEPGDMVELAAGEERKIDFTVSGPDGVEVVKSFTFRGDSYISDLALTVSKGGAAVPNVKLAVGASIGDHAINNHNFYHIESETVAAVGGHIIRHQGYYSFEFDANNQASLRDEGAVDWAGVSDAYFAMVAIPAVQTQGVEYSSFKYEHQTVKPFFDGIFSWILRTEKTSETRHLTTAYVPVTSDGTVTKIFTGTKDYFLLSELNESLSASVGREIDIEDLINFSNYRVIRYITKPLSVPILYSLNFLNGFTHNYGVAIIVFTFFFYSLLFPLRWSQSKSFKKAAGNAPKMKEIQDKIKALQKKGVSMEAPEMRQLQMEQLKLTKDALPIGGCLPMLLQFPLLIAFYTAVTVSLAIRQADFLWLPDLSAGDPYHVLEFAFAASMVLAMKFTPTSPTVTPEQQMQQKIMMYLMPAMMLWIMWQAPSGLLVYWFFGNIVSFGQQLVINRLNKTPEPAKQEIVDAVPKNAKKVK